MIVLGADMHKSSHTIAAVGATTGELLGDKTIQVGDRGFAERCALGARRSAASGCGRWRTAGTSRARFERFLLARGERVVRVATRLMAGDAPRRRASAASPTASTRSPSPGRRCAKASRRAAGRAAGGRRARHPAAGRSPRTARSACAPRSTTTLLWHLHDLWPELDAARQRAALEEVEHADRAAPGARRADRAGPDRPRRAAPPARAHRTTINALEAEIAELVAEVAPQLLAEPGFGPLTAAKLIGEIAGAQRFASDAKLARAAGIAPIPVSSGKTNRHRLDRGGNRQINTAIHRVAVTRAALPPRDQGLHRTQTRRRQDQPRSHPLPQAPPRPPHLAPAPAAPARQNTAPTSIS